MNTWTALVRGHGVIRKIVTNPNLKITQDSIVHVTATEMGDLDGGFRPFIGAASIEVLNVAPQANGNVDVRINILWDSDLDVRLSYTLDQVAGSPSVPVKEQR
jgi:hypothetical protein